ncbi:MAG: carboxymuconolactone decarboxylase family protein [Anaerolineales bacterium]|jgi:alkylhydroperoxidase/carboxymuconolactone decarboxylase family protein YurZ|nr:hypothetical protein [Anaerolineaceae bacterium]MDP6225075.1 carboxymuconolactone decarboxylase family protein [Anaerolineales bacterium]MDP7544813.1 carboxymuconolactone decarboxylase family protein [Anaerolineales bacterium]MDP7644875.1 carboxymuconolactone decarboxylase family protein [Anaerolineales bacterium]HJL70909.1 carboxymuconolactone decarboxylase family protein [Anaerolineales bacterium]|tara:strand:- start:1129 stop:1407 length:279 start_codon:yes stop_codon:yes gene_type:complete
MTETESTRDRFYGWANKVFSGEVFDVKTGNLMGLAAALVTGHSGAVSYFYFSAQKAGASEDELAAAADVAAAASGLNVYALMPKAEEQKADD